MCSPAHCQTVTVPPSFFGNCRVFLSQYILYIFQPSILFIYCIFFSNGFSVFKVSAWIRTQQGSKNHVSDQQWLQHHLQSAVPSEGGKKKGEKRKVPHNLFQSVLLVEASGSTNHCEVENDEDQNNVKLHFFPPTFQQTMFSISVTLSGQR